MDATLVLVYKKPALGVGKQRLAAGLGAELALQIAQALLACAMEDAADWPGPVVLAPASHEDKHWAQEQAGQFLSRFTVVPQISGNLGQRINALDQTLRDQNLTQLVFIGSDSPGLRRADYLSVRTCLERSDAVLIPAVDGGVVLMASRCAWPDLSTLPWSTDRLGSALIQVCQTGMQSMNILNENYDIDEAENFFRLMTTLRNDTRPARRVLHALASEIAATRNTDRNSMHV